MENSEFLEYKTKILEAKRRNELVFPCVLWGIVREIFQEAILRRLGIGVLGRRIRHYIKE